jgi:hypothetical protein
MSLRFVGPALVAAIAAATPSLVAAADIDLVKGRLVHQDSTSIQAVAATNHTARRIGQLEVECGFYRGAVFLAPGDGVADNIAPGQTAYLDVYSHNSEGSDTVECRVVSSE